MLEVGVWMKTGALEAVGNVVTGMVLGEMVRGETWE